MRKIYAYAVLVSLLSQNICFADPKLRNFNPGPNDRPEFNSEQKASEYVMRRFPGERLVAVRIVGGVNRPGTYYFPEGMDLLSAISLSGGLIDKADSENIKWSQFATQKNNSLSLAEMMEKPKDLNPILGANDVVFVEEKRPWFSDNSLALLGVVSSIIGITIGVKYLSK